MKKALLVAPLAFVLMAGAGCSSSINVGRTPSGPAGTPSATPSAPTVATAPTNTGCANEYFPLEAGYRVTYSNQLSSGTSSTYTMKVTSVSGNRATVALDFDSGMHSDQVYECTNGNVQATGYVDLAAGMSGVRATAQTRSVSGQLIPQDVHVGSSWSSTFNITSSIAGMEGVPARNIDATVTTQRTAETEEDVTVPAGTFHALKVRSSTSFAFGGSAVGLPPLEPVVGYEWWVKGKGMVKTTSGLDGQAISSVATTIVTP